MPTLTDLHDDLLDENDYPTDGALDLIPAWTGTPEQLIHDVLSPIFRAYGTVLIEEFVDDLGRDCRRVRLATGGWSGCESAISALGKSLFWTAWWVRSERGGLFVFDVPGDRWQAAMIEWPQMPDPYLLGWNQAIAVVREHLAVTDNQADSELLRRLEADERTETP